MAGGVKDGPTMKGGLVKRGDTWSYVVRVRDPLTGKKKARWVGGFATQREARAARDAARDAANKGTSVAPSRVTVREYLEEWLEGQATQRKPTTLASYTMHVRHHIVPRIGGERLQELTPGTLTALYAALLTEGRRSKRKTPAGCKPEPNTGLSASTVRRVAATLHKALADAVSVGLLPANPCDRAKPPKVERDADGAGVMKTWTPEQLGAFLTSVADDRYYALWHLAAHTGMRRGELAGLAWSDVDLQAGAVSVQRARVALPSGEVRESKPKTDRGRRRIDIDPATRAALKLWSERQAREHDEQHVASSGYVFTDVDGGPLHPDFISRAFRMHQRRAARALAKRGKEQGGKMTLPVIRFHDLRHTHASILMVSGVPAKVVSERLGHSTVAFTLQVYSHVLPGMQAEAAERFAAAVAKAAPALRVANA